MDMVNLIEKALDIRAYYHRVISGNIANVETPAYKEKDIDFKKELDRNINSDEKRFMGDDIEVKESKNNEGLVGIDGNTVNIENQMVKLTENQLMFHSLVQVMAKQFSIMRYLIREGK
jgi:flagellar basal-body rod protein FlgB